MQPDIIGRAIVAVVLAITTYQTTDEAVTPISAAQVRPRWTVGDSWIVECKTPTIQVRDHKAGIQESKSVRWRFVVKSLSPFDGKPAFRIDVRCVGEIRRPRVTLWVDHATMSTRQIEYEVPTKTGFRKLTESYYTASGQASPILGPLPALPIDIPVFLENAKSLKQFEYQARAQPVGAKNVAGNLAFAIEVKQEETATPTMSADVGKLIHSEFAKNVAVETGLRIKLQSHGRVVKQLWMPKAPWPLHSSNGVTTSRLVEFSRKK